MIAYDIFIQLDIYFWSRQRQEDGRSSDDYRQ
jgi:hypothetical protein